MFTEEILRPLRQSLSASAAVLLPGDAEFVAKCASWNLDFSAKPTLIIWVACTEDVVAAVRFIRTHSLPFTVGCGFHSRYSLREGHVLINLGGMRKVQVDPTLMVARAQGGARNEDLDLAGFAVHLHTTAGTNPDTGLGGLILGGGIGYLVRQLGMSIDNLEEVELVDAQGRVLRASEKSEPELFWAMRGAGFNFGIVTEFVLRVHRVGHQLRALTADDEAIAARYQLPPQEKMEHLMVQGVLPYPLDAYPRLMQRMDEKWVQKGKDGPLRDRGLSLGLALAARGPHGGPAMVVPFAHTGDVYNGYRALEELVQDLGPPLAPLTATIRVDSYIALQHANDPFTPSAHYYERAYIAQTAPPGLAEAGLQLIHKAANTPGLQGCVMILLTLGADGAMTDHMGQGAYSDVQRRGNYFVSPIGRYQPPEATREVALKWANEAREAILPFSSTVYTNASNAQPGSRAVYGGSLERLRRVKQKYDPTNFFCNNQNVVPAEMDENQQEMALPKD